MHNAPKISKISFGTWRLLENNTPLMAKIILEEAIKIGINLFDTALVYSNGESEKLIGDIKNKYPDIYVSTKIPGKIIPDERSSIEEIYPRNHMKIKLIESLNNLNLDKIDFLQLHNWNLHWKGNEVEALMTDLLEIKEKGRAGFIGISLPKWSNPNFLEELPFKYIDFIQLPFSIYQQWGDLIISNMSIMEKIVFSRSPFEHGLLNTNRNTNLTTEDKEYLSQLAKDTGISIADLPIYALNFCFLDTRIDSTIVGINSLESLNLLAFHINHQCRF